MNYEDQKKHEGNFLSLTSLTVVEFEHGNALFKGTAQKLFFLLVYPKNNPLRTFQAASFGVSQPKVSAITRWLLSVLDDALGGMGLLPYRDSAELAGVPAGHRKRVFWLDGVEAGVQRNADRSAQREEFSGKKRGHRLDAQAGPGLSGPRASGCHHRAALQEAQGRPAHRGPENIQHHPQLDQDRHRARQQRHQAAQDAQGRYQDSQFPCS